MDKKPTAIKNNTLTVKLDSREVELSKLPLKKYTEFLDILDKMPRRALDLDGKTLEQQITTIPSIIKNSLPDVTKLLELATPLGLTEIEELALDEASKLVVGIIEVNRYKEVYDELKKVFAQPETKTLAKEEQEIGSPGR